MTFNLTPEVIATIIIAIVLAVVLKGFLSGEKKEKKGPIKLSKPVLKKVTVEEVAKHNTRDDCWLIVNDKVYDVSSYINEHPGGDAILRHAGKDASIPVVGPQHASSVMDILNYYLMGEIEK